MIKGHFIVIFGVDSFKLKNSINYNIMVSVFYMLSSDHGFLSTYSPYVDKCILIGARRAAPVYRLRSLLFQQRNTMNSFVSLQYVQDHNHVLTITTSPSKPEATHLNTLSVSRLHFDLKKRPFSFDICDLFLFDDIQQIESNILSLNGVYIDTDVCLPDQIDSNMIDDMNRMFEL